MNTVQITNFSYINGQQKVIAVTFNVFDETGRLIRSNLRRSYTLLNDSDLLQQCEDIIGNITSQIEI